jgi:hypothetical protein
LAAGLTSEAHRIHHDFVANELGCQARMIGPAWAPENKWMLAGFVFRLMSLALRGNVHMATDIAH